MDTPQTLAADMLKAAAAAVVTTRAVVAKGSLNVKTEGRRNAIASSGERARHAPLAINYDVSVNKTAIEGEIGYDISRDTLASRQARLDNLLEYGSPQSPPHRDLGRALDSEEPRFEKALGEAIERLL